MKRRWGRVAAGLAAAVVGMFAFSALYLSAGDKEEVVVMNRTVTRYSPITDDDLKLVRVATEPGVNSIPASERDALVDRYAQTDLVEGAMLTEDQLFPEDTPRIDPGEAVVGAHLGPADLPSVNAPVGAEITVVIRPTSGGQGGEERAFRGWLLEVGTEDENTGKRRVSVVVNAGDAPEISAAAGDERLSVVFDQIDQGG